MFIFTRLSYLCCISALMVNFANALTANSGSAAPENIDMLLTADKIIIGTNYAGSNLYVAGVITNTDPLAWRQNRYDVIITLEGPSHELIVRQKKRKLGMWLNADAVNFQHVPLFYALASTRLLQDVTSTERLKNLGIGFSYLQLRGVNLPAAKEKIFREALVAIKQNQHLYSLKSGGVIFDKGSLFSARFAMPANVPVGQYHATAYLVKDGVFIGTASSEFSVVKAHFAYSVYHLAHNNSVIYGLICVILAVVTSFVGRFIFRKD